MEISSVTNVETFFLFSVAISVQRLAEMTYEYLY